MGTSLIGKVALVTGSTQGIGRAIARILLENKAIVFVNGRTKSTIDETVKEWREKNLKAFGFVGDVTKESTTVEFIETVVKECGRIDILINTVGGGSIKYLEKISANEWDETMRNNMKSAFLLSKAIIPLMKKQNGGKIINISSTSGIRGKVGGTHYAAAKSGLIGFTKALALEVGPFNIQVNAVAPGFIDTKRTRHIYSNNEIYPSNIAEIISQETPLKRTARVDDVAKTVLFLSSELSDFITGQVLIIDGGKTI